MLLPKLLKMVNLGFIRDASQSPADTPRVLLRRAASLDSARPTICAWSDKKGHRYELCWDVPADGRRAHEWGADMAASLRDLGWKEWWLDTQSIAATFGTSVTESLNLWGKAFWPHFDQNECTVYVQVGDTLREAAYESILVWQKAFPHVVFDTSCDIDLREKQDAEARANATLSERVADLFTRIRERL